MAFYLLLGTVLLGLGLLAARSFIQANPAHLAQGVRAFIAAFSVLASTGLLFTVFATGELSGATTDPLWGQAGRQLFFIAVSVYGWYRWSQSRAAGGAADGGAIAPRWATGRERLLLVGLAVGGYAAAYLLLLQIGSWGPRTEAWILAGSMLATYGMARGWVEFWLVWILVDVVGVTTLIRAGYYPTAAMYVFYGGFCVVGFFAWWRAQRNIARETTGPQAAEVTA